MWLIQNLNHPVFLVKIYLNIFNRNAIQTDLNLENFKENVKIVQDLHHLVSRVVFHDKSKINQNWNLSHFIRD